MEVGEESLMDDIENMGENHTGNSCTDTATEDEENDENQSGSPTFMGNGSPSKEYYKWKLKSMIARCEVQRKKIRVLQQINRRKEKKIVELSSILQRIKEKNLLHEDDFDVISRASKPYEELLTRQLAKARGSAQPREYSTELKSFALNLHFYSPRAHNYVRETFNTCLPHPRTITKWYKKIDCEPGFTAESLHALSLKAKQSEIFCSLIIDEIAIRKHTCFDGTKCHGYVNIGSGDDDSRLAREALVFMVVAINGSWKIPGGYFLIDGIHSSQKASLVKECLQLTHETGIKIVSLTFDGLASNISMATHLGCNFEDFSNLGTVFEHPVTKEGIAVFFYPCHMLKLVRNTLGEKRVMVDGEGNFIKWKFIEELHFLQQKEGLHLGNKLKGSHINFHKQKMKVRLASQIFSDSVADAIEFCCTNMKMPSFQNCEGTVKFIRCMNKIFDVFNSRSIMQLPHKKPINEKNIERIFEFLQTADIYLSNLSIYNHGTKESEKALDSNRKTGFLGFKICISSLMYLSKELIKQHKLNFIPTYKFSQDHLELFFSAIRFMGGSNNNPTASHFKSAYRKLLIHKELKDCKTGNCNPLEQVSILSCSSTESPVNIINASSDRNMMIDELDITQKGNIEDHSYCTYPSRLSEFVDECVEYISGFIVRNLSNKLHCEICIKALFGDAKAGSLTTVKNKGGLCNPSDDVIQLCRKCESFFRVMVRQEGEAKLLQKFSVLKFMNAVLNSSLGKDLFPSLKTHVHDMSPMENHCVHLIREISRCYFKIRLSHLSKQQLQCPSVRSLHTKLILFKNQ